MIFVITGTEAYPFDRMIEEIDSLKEKNSIQDEVYIQSGSCTYESKHCAFDKWLPFNDMCDNIKKSDLVIAHAGAGTTLLCLDLGKTPIIITRQKKHNEHLDDHQIPFAQMMEKLNYAVVAYDVSEIKECIDSLKKNQKGKNKYKKDNSKLVSYLNSWLND